MTDVCSVPPTAIQFIVFVQVDGVTRQPILIVNLAESVPRSAILQPRRDATMATIRAVISSTGALEMNSSRASAFHRPRLTRRMRATADSTTTAEMSRGTSTTRTLARPEVLRQLESQRATPGIPHRHDRARIAAMTGRSVRGLVQAEKFPTRSDSAASRVRVARSSQASTATVRAQWTTDKTAPQPRQPDPRRTDAAPPVSAATKTGDERERSSCGVAEFPEAEVRTAAGRPTE